MPVFLYHLGQEISLWLQAIWNKVQDNSRRSSFSQYWHCLSRLSTQNNKESLTLGSLQWRISIETTKVKKSVRLSISDNGGGVSAEFRPQLFDLLSTTKQTGMSLGLWLCKHIVTRYGGLIHYEDALGVVLPLWLNYPQLHRASARHFGSDWFCPVPQRNTKITLGQFFVFMLFYGFILYRMKWWQI
jgi:hypothetical protein